LNSRGKVATFSTSLICALPQKRERGKRGTSRTTLPSDIKEEKGRRARGSRNRQAAAALLPICIEGERGKAHPPIKPDRRGGGENKKASQKTNALRRHGLRFSLEGGSNPRVDRQEKKEVVSRVFLFTGVLCKLIEEKKKKKEESSSLKSPDEKEKRRGKSGE